MPLEPYEYPEVLYCDQCGQDVDTKIEERTATYTRDGEDFQVSYRAAVCPVCGKTLCERDQDFAFVNAISQMEEQPKEQPAEELEPANAVCIRLPEALDRLQRIRENLLADRKNMAAGTVGDCIRALSALPHVKPELRIITPESHRIVAVEPYFEGGMIGRDVYRCERCRAKVDRHDLYCHECGGKLVDRDV